MNKQLFKKLAPSCALCDEDDCCLFDVHRIEEGGKYAEWNCIAICVKCHRRHHSGKIKILDKLYSTAGWVVIYEEDGIEKIKTIN